jgi:hypothetical protein
MRTGVFSQAAGYREAPRAEAAAPANARERAGRPGPRREGPDSGLNRARQDAPKGLKELKAPLKGPQVTPEDAGRDLGT